MYDTLERLSEIQYNSNGGNTFSTAYRYTYDANGNITEIRINNVLRYSYEYDKFGQLTRENNADTGKTVKYFYDNAGNITLKRTYSYTTASNLSGLTYTTVYYTYDSPEEYSNNYFGGLWGDLLTNYNGQEITYDADGNPLTIGEDISLTWTQGRRLARYTLYGDVDIEFTYNSDGIRTRKTVEGITHYYTLDGSRILSEEWTTGAGSNAVRHLMVYVYDASGSPIGFRYRNSTESERVFHQYIYGKNIQGDILYIFGLDGTLYASYVYDAWGKQSVTYYNSGNNNNLVPGVKYNPFTYRGYYYDAETGLYYVSSRYYDPEVGRFINADGYISTGQGLLGYNMFAYCLNNPVNMQDPFGEIAITTLILIGSIVAGCLVAGHTAATSYKYTGKVDVGNTILAGVGTFLTVYTWGMSAYAAYLTYCDYKGYTPVTNIGKTNTNPTPYSNLTDPKDVAPGKDFTAKQKSQIIEQNKARNHGVVKSDLSGKVLTQPQKSMKGITPSPDEWQIDHITPKSAGGTNSFSNAQVLSRAENRIKWDK